ncbi:hypothetical protein VTO73DRAFT_6454 [Trametes versicolor]
MQISYQDLYDIWKDMGWKRSVKAKHLVMAIRDHFVEKNASAIAAGMQANASVSAPGETTPQVAEATQEPEESADQRTAVSGQDDQVANGTMNTTQQAPQVANQERAIVRGSNQVDAWAFQYLTVSRVQPLVEAIDNDFSNYVTVSELNAFTAARPVGWSLPRWIAYWTCGFEMSVQWYYRRILALFSAIHFASRSVLPANREMTGRFLSEPHMRFVVDLLAGLHPLEGWRFVDGDWEATFAKFKDYVVAQEDQLEKRLRRIKYLIDEVNTLTSLVVDPADRPEIYVLPIVFFLLRRSLFIIRQASDVALHQDELGTIVQSLRTIATTVRERISTLQVMFRFKNLSDSEQLDGFSFGLYARLQIPTSSDRKPWPVGPFWMTDPTTDSVEVASSEPLFQKGPRKDQLDIEPDGDEPPLCFGSEIEPLDVVLPDGTGTDSVNAHESPVMAHSPNTLTGVWGGCVTANNRMAGEARQVGLVRLEIRTQAPDGTITGGGTDAWGPFNLRGSFIGNRVSFVNDYILPQRGEKAVWHYEATVQDDLCAMDGSWGRPESNYPWQHYTGIFPHSTMWSKIPPPETRIGELAVFGTFTLVRRPVEYFYVWPSPEDVDGATSRPRALWKRAIGAALQIARIKLHRLSDWPALQTSCRMRERYFALTSKQIITRGNLDPAEQREREGLLQIVPPNVLHVWNMIGAFRFRRELIHSSICCDACTTKYAPKPITGGRLICVDCTGNMDKSVDFCFTCFSGNAHTLLPPHTLIQLRSITMRVYMFSILKAAREMVSRRANPDNTRLPNAPGSSASCASCRSTIDSEKSHWCCLDCADSAYVCAKCNSDIERQKPWLRERRPNPDYTRHHDWSHTLLFISGNDTTLSKLLAARKHLATDDRLMLLEAKLDELTTGVKACLAQLGAVSGGRANAEQEPTKGANESSTWGSSTCTIA